MSDAEVWATIAGLAAISVVARSFFMISNEPWPLPGWARAVLKVAPLAVLVAVIAPEVFMTQGEIIATWRDPRWPAVLAASGYFFWRRGILGTILVGMTVMLLLKLGLGW
ncbi:AzlD domain-containing protein [Inhella gelatinilytica]|uniref:AzlD domain-containing protein n=1 Tax=Inhella gelatinilytica TaxID=2795030 RepID=A0A931J1T4_9BURK|nr:AzlD domain-containing protein [Inhella gelatinilytica]MBH9553928.1 AzlD domain-containing protein [Inhella gelatinilytica]